LVEHECPRCQRPVELPLGELCGACRRQIERRASRIGRLAALVSTVVVGIYVLVRMPAEPTPRMVGAASIAIWYLLTYFVVKRVMREYLK
jgi:hypothetical protein